MKTDDRCLYLFRITDLVNLFQKRSKAFEALLLNLETEPHLGIRRSIKPAALPREAIAYLSPRPRMTYFFEPAHELEAEFAG